MEKYTLHYRNTHFPFLFVGLVFIKGGYGDFEYVVLQDKDESRGYLSFTGVNQARRFSKIFLNENSCQKILFQQKMLITELRDFSLSNGNFLKDNPQGYWLKIKELCFKIGHLYRYCEQPMQAILEEKVLEAAKNQENLTRALSDEDFAREIVFNQQQLNYLERLHDFGKMEYELHIAMEVIFTSIYEFAASVGSKFGYAFDEILIFKVEEIDKLFLGIMPSSLEINERLKGIAYFPLSEKILTGKKYEYWQKKLEPKIDVPEIRGAIAQKGFARGVVKIHLSIIHVQDLPTGCVLVAGMTNPQMLPYLSKVSAIITDEGGLTCHAAIISRELKVPCIVGTKIVTQVLKDGDLVEVDADNGVVRILERA
ncbi:MAG: hypothetical protein HGA61_03625 [Candidatus Moranbacteria bacterium]|nr:hypothetical protein [Candidatus Moranbacteria bacterium]